MKKVVMTGSPKSAGFKTKGTFFAQLEEFGYSEEKKIKAKNSNGVDILITDTPESTTNKMQDARKYGVEIMTYEDLVDAFDLECDL